MEKFSYNFYTEELQLVLFSAFPYDTFKIHDTEKDKLLVEKLNSKETVDFKWIKKDKILK